MLSRASIRTFLPALVLLAGADARATSVGLGLYGSGTAGSGGITPRIWTRGSAWPGNSTFQLTLDEALGGSAAMLVVGPAPSDIPLLGIHLLVQPWFLSPPLPLAGTPGPGGGSLRVSTPLPPDPNLLGLELYNQWLVVDSGAQRGFSASPGLKVTVTARPLVVSCGSAGTLDPIYALDPISGALANWSVGANNPSDVQFSPDGTLMVLAATRQFIVADTQGNRLASVNISYPGVCNSTAITPDGKRCYGLIGGTQGSNRGEIIVIDLDTASSTFGQQIGTVAGFPRSMEQLEGVGISGDGKTLTACNLGLGQQPAIFIVDIDPTSPNYNTVRHQINTSGLMTDIEPVRDGSLAYAVAASLASASQVLVVDCRVGAIVGVVPGLGRFATDIDVDPLDEYAYLATPNSDQVTRINIDLGDPGYLSVLSSGTLMSQPFSLALSPDAASLYVVEQGGNNLYQIDTRTMGLVQTFILGPAGYAGIAAR